MASHGVPTLIKALSVLENIGRIGRRLSIRRSTMTESDRPGPDQPEERQARPEDEKLPAAAHGDLLAVLPLRDIVVFPHMIVPLFVGREKSVRALEAVMKDDKQILLASQRDATEDEPRPEGI